MKISGSEPIARLAMELRGARGVFEAFGLDYACTGTRSLDDAAHVEGIDPETVIAALQRAQRNAPPLEPWHDRSLTDLTKHLETEHHRFVRDELASVAMRLSESCSRTNDVPEDLTSMRSAFARLSELLLPHFHREEENLFPVIEALEKAWQSGAAPAVDASGVSDHIRQLTLEHGTASAQLRTIRRLRLRLGEANDLAPRCRTILDDMATLEAHLHEYIFLENSVVFPRALALEKQFAPETHR